MVPVLVDLPLIQGQLPGTDGTMRRSPDTVGTSLRLGRHASSLQRYVTTVEPWMKGRPRYLLRDGYTPVYVNRSAVEPLLSGSLLFLPVLPCPSVLRRFPAAVL